MSRMKSYQASGDRATQVAATSPPQGRSVPNESDAYIDMLALLGPDARFATKQRVLDLRPWLGRGVDPWVCASGFCLKAMLRSGSYTTASVTTYCFHLRFLFQYLTNSKNSSAISMARGPSSLLPIHVLQFIGWLKMRAQTEAWSPHSTRSIYKAAKAVLVEMFSQGLILGEPSRFFPRKAVSSSATESRHTSLSDTEQQRLANAIKSDLIAVHHGRSKLTQCAVQSLRLLTVAHRQGLNPTPLLEMRRDALAPGLLPGTIRIRTSKYRNRKTQSSAGQAARTSQRNAQPLMEPTEQDLLFDLAEGAVLNQAIASTSDLVLEAPEAIKHRIWLHRSVRTTQSIKKGTVICLTASTLTDAIRRVVLRHRLLGDDDQPLRLNLSRLRKSFFDRALRIADGNMAITANLMGNTPRVAGAHYPSMNEARTAQAAEFMNQDYSALMRAKTQPDKSSVLQVVQVLPLKASADTEPGSFPTPTPVSSCRDSIRGEHAPHDGASHCDRFVMCLFCSSFAIVGTVEELWRLFSFQAFAKAEIDYLDESLGAERTTNEVIEDLRDRYRLVIPYIDDFTQRQFAVSRITTARAKAAVGLHPYWQHHMTMSRGARRGALEQESRIGSPRDDAGAGDHVGG